MITILQQTGNNALKAATPSSKLRFTSFRTGNQENVPLRTDYQTVQGDDAYNYLASSIKYVPVDSGRVTLQLLVEAALPQRTITNVMLYTGSPISTAFCMCIGEMSFVKTATTTDGTGMRWMLQLDLRIPNIYDKIDFSNLQQNTVDILRVEDEAAFNAAPFDMMARDQIMLQHHEATGRVIPLLNINGKYWGCPLLYRLDKDNKRVFDGGQAGDGYKYTGEITDWLDIHRWVDWNTWNDTDTWSDT